MWRRESACRAFRFRRSTSAHLVGGVQRSRDLVPKTCVLFRDSAVLYTNSLPMLLTVKDACDLHPMALEYSMSEQVENLSDVITAASKSAREFFEKNYITKGMETLLSQGLQRLGGQSDQAVFELKQAMG